jgi:hypothetical protein
MATLTAPTSRPCLACGAPCSVTVSDSTETGAILFKTDAWVVRTVPHHPKKYATATIDRLPQFVCSDACRTKLLYLEGES